MTDVQDFTFEAGAEAERLGRAFETFGVVVLKNLIAEDKLNEQRAAVNRLLAMLRSGTADVPVPPADVEDLAVPPVVVQQLEVPLLSVSAESDETNDLRR